MGNITLCQSCSVCEGTSIKKLLCCSDGLSGHNHVDDKQSHIFYASQYNNNSFVLLNTPLIYTQDIICSDDITNSSYTLFFKDQENVIRILSHKSANDHTYIISTLYSCTSNPTSPKNNNDTKTETKELCSYKAEEIIQPQLINPLLRIMESTLNGRFQQYQGLFNGHVKFIRSYPIVESLGEVTMGILIIGHSTPLNNAQINDVLNDHHENKSEHSSNTDSDDHNMDGKMSIAYVEASILEQKNRDYEINCLPESLGMDKNTLKNKQRNNKNKKNNKG